MKNTPCQPLGYAPELQHDRLYLSNVHFDHLVHGCVCVGVGVGVCVFLCHAIPLESSGRRVAAKVCSLLQGDSFLVGVAACFAGVAI